MSLGNKSLKTAILISMNANQELVEINQSAKCKDKTAQKFLDSQYTYQGCYRGDRPKRGLIFLQKSQLFWTNILAKSIGFFIGGKREKPSRFFCLNQTFNRKTPSEIQAKSGKVSSDI